MTSEPSNAATGPGEDSAFRVALVCMPFHLIGGPSAAIGLLQAIAERAGFSTDCYHLNLDLAARLDRGVYDALCRTHHDQLCEWLFSVAAFEGESSSADADYLAECPGVIEFARRFGWDTSLLTRLRHEIVPRFVDDCIASTDWGQYRVVGFTSTFQQQVASLALARRIKERWPEVVIVFGGANLEGEAGEEFIRCFPFIDYVAVGDADVSFPALLRGLASHSPPDEVAGLLMRTADGIRSTGRAELTRDLDTLPTANHDEFFERAGRLGLTRRSDCGWFLPFEGSRGCWWGQKHQCTFCGFNTLGIAYRSKSPERLLQELAVLAQRYGITSFSATDSIMDMRMVERFFAEVRDRKIDFEFYYETKSNLTRRQIHTLYRGGARTIQPGVESLSSNVLRLMNKGATVLHNLRYLKWARYYKVQAAWNLLWGVPGETEQDYRQELEVVKRISHLEPPGTVGPVWVERFSPLFTDHQRYPIRNLRPQRSYRYVYPPSLDIDRVAFFFDCEMDDTVAADVHRQTIEWIERWRQRWFSGAPDTLFYRRTPGVLIIEDSRDGWPRGTHRFGEPFGSIYAACDETMRGPSQVQSSLATGGGASIPSEEGVKAIMDEFCRLGLMVEENGRYLSLAIPANPNW